MLGDQHRFGTCHIDKSPEAVFCVFGIQDFRGAIPNVRLAVLAKLAEIAMAADLRWVCCEVVKEWNQKLHFRLPSAAGKRSRLARAPNI